MTYNDCKEFGLEISGGVESHSALGKSVTSRLAMSICRLDWHKDVEVLGNSACRFNEKEEGFVASGCDVRSFQKKSLYLDANFLGSLHSCFRCEEALLE